LWIGTEGNGAACLDLLSEKWTVLNVANHVLPSDVVNCITVDNSAHVIWIGTDNGMVRYEPRSGNYRHYGFEDGLSNVLVYASGFDHLGRLWAAFYIGNPAIFNPEKNRWRSVEGAPSVICYGLSPNLRKRAMWMATAQGIINYDIERRKYVTYWDNIEFRSLLFDEEKKEIWAGSWEQGLFHLSIECGRKQKIREFEKLSILDIRKDRWENKLWFATSSGVFSFDGKEKKLDHLDAADGLGTNYVLAIGLTKDSVWFGTWGGGLSRLSR
jgi:ligand-binding sensor domain-containing protein